MFKKTVVTMALVMMASQAFAVDLHTEADAARETKDKATREHVVDQKADVVQDAALKADIDDVTLEMRSVNAKLADGVSKTLAKSADMTLTVKGKQVPAREALNHLANKIRDMRKAGLLKQGSQELKDVATVVEFFAFATRVNEAGGKAEQAVQHEMSLGDQILTWKGASHDSHIALMRKTLEIEKANNSKQDVAFFDAIKNIFGEQNATNKTEEIIKCD